MPDTGQIDITSSPAAAQTASVDFASLATQASSMLNTPDSGLSTGSPTGATTTSVLAVERPVAAGQPVIPQTGTQTQPQSEQPQTATLIDVDLGNGRVEKLTTQQLAEAYHNGLRQADYTRKTQQLAAERQALLQQQAELQARAQQLSNPQMQMQQALQTLQQQLSQTPQQAQQPVDPSQPLTIGQFQQMYGQLQQQYVQQQQAAQQYVEDRLQVAHNAEKINASLDNLFQRHPVLKVIPEFEDIMRYRVALTQPADLDSTLKGFENTAAEISQQILGFQSAAGTQQAIQQRQELVKHGIEPPTTGGAPQIQTQNYRKQDGKLDWARLAAGAQSIVNGG